jgi:hypothetical protein
MAISSPILYAPLVRSNHRIVIGLGPPFNSWGERSAKSFRATMFRCSLTLWAASST